VLLAGTFALALALGACDTSSEPSGDDASDGVSAETGEAGEARTPQTVTLDAEDAPPPRPRSYRVARVIDGDTIDLRNGRRIRLLQIDSPESDGECYGQEAGTALSKILPAGTKVVLERDPVLDNVDRYGRLLRYIHRGERNVNLVLVKRGAASVWFFDGDRGRYAERLLAAARSARRHDRGAWGACRAKLDPFDAFETRSIPMIPVFSPGGGSSDGGSCAAGYSPCLPVTGDLDCADVEAMGKAPVSVTGDDPYRLDRDDDGIGCE
jgi:micrococcal nuclease